MRNSLPIRCLVLAAMLVAMLSLSSCATNGLDAITISPTSYTATLVYTSSGTVAPIGYQINTQYKAIGKYGNGSHPFYKDITSVVTWTSYTPAMVTVSSTGLAQVTGAMLGTTQVTAAMQGFGGLVTSNTSTFTVAKSTTTAAH